MESIPRVIAEKKEKALNPVATKSTDENAIHRVHSKNYRKDDIRTEFARDHTRIIHNRAFRRLRHKTQVFVSPNNDHICTRMEHSLHVASIAKTIANVLDLNHDLVEAIAIGHDLGHPPFGHRGEMILSELATAHGLNEFHHELHSLRVVDFVDRYYDEHPGLNLTFAVRDGIACHYGEGVDPNHWVLKPNRSRTPDELPRIIRGTDLPATLEGCVVRFCDRIAYIGRDIEDAQTVGIIQKEEIPSDVTDVLGDSNRSIIHRMVIDLINSSKGELDDQDCIRVSDEKHQAFKKLYEFSIQYIYNNPNVQKHFAYIEEAMKQMFNVLLGLVTEAIQGGTIDPIEKRIAKHKELCIVVLKDFLEKDIFQWKYDNPVQLTIDYIAGMTDRFFMNSYEGLFLT